MKKPYVTMELNLRELLVTDIVTTSDGLVSEDETLYGVLDSWWKGASN